MDQLRTLEEEFNKNPTPSKRSKAAKAAAERSKERIEEIIELVRKLHNGQSVDEGLLIKRELNGKEYRQLLNRLAEDHELQEYIRDKLR